MPKGFSTCEIGKQASKNNDQLQSDISPGLTYDNTSNAVLGVAVALELVGNGGENARGEGHVVDSVLLLLALLNLLEVLVEVDERVILVVLTGDVGAELAEAVQLLFDFLGGGLDV